MVPTGDGGFLLGGASSAQPGATKSSPNYGADDVSVVRIDSDGTRLWDRSFGGTDSDTMASVVVMPDGSFVVGGRNIGTG